MQPTKNVSSAYPFESKYADVLGSKIHYIEAGEGKPIVFIHGNPTSSYLWRNVIPYLSAFGRCIAFDLIGMGKSSKPQNSRYDFKEQYDHAEGFIEAMGLDEITFVLHEWGGALGSYYASRHPQKVRAIALMESIIQPDQWKSFPWNIKRLFKKWAGEKNYSVDKVIPSLTLRKMTKSEMDHYLTPFQDSESQKPALVWSTQLPIEGSAGEVHKILEKAFQFLQSSEIPKLWLWAEPGAIIRKRDVKKWQKQWRNLQIQNVGEGKHFLPEDQPHSIGTSLARWVKQQNTLKEDFRHEVDSESSCV